MARFDFDAWWRRYMESRRETEDPHDSAQRLRRKLRKLAGEDADRFLDGALERLLGRERRYGVALFLLAGLSESRLLRDYARHLLPLPALQSDDEESHLADLVRILAAANDRKLLPAVETYLLERAPGPHWASVPWALWPRRRQLFARAWCRYFVERDPRDWRNTLIVKAFLAEPGAVELVRAPLRERSPERWEALREALLRSAGTVSWLSEDQREALERAVS